MATTCTCRDSVAGSYVPGEVLAVVADEFAVGLLVCGVDAVDCVCFVDDAVQDSRGIIGTEDVDRSCGRSLTFVSTPPPG